MVLQLEKTILYGDYAMPVFLDVSEVSNKVSVLALMEQFLNCRTVIADWSESLISRKAVRGNPLGADLFPLVWKLIFNTNLLQLSGRKAGLTAHKHDFSLIISGK